MGCISYNCTDPIGEHTMNDCGTERQGGASAALLFACGSLPTDPTNGIEINALIAAGNAWKIENVNVSYEAASPVTIDSNVPCQPPVLINYDRTGTLVDTNVNENNVEFYNNVFSGKRKFGGMLIIECGNEDDPKAKYIDKTISWTGSDIMPNNNSEWQRFEAAFSWKTRKPNVLIVNVPQGVF